MTRTRTQTSQPTNGAVWFIALIVIATTMIVSPIAANAQTQPASQVDVVTIVKDATGLKLQVSGRDFMVFGMNWGYMPIGENYAYSLWSQPDDVIIAALAREMPLLQAMGCNAIRQYVGIPPRWVQYIYETYGIYTILNHAMARYGFTLDGVWTPTVDYSDPTLRQAVTDEIVTEFQKFVDTPGILMWLLGNENNYGLSWKSFEIEALPEGERNAARARHLYTLFNDVTLAIKAIDTKRPVAICNGDVQYIDIIAEECTDIDIFGTNVYRGISARDLYDVVSQKLDCPIVYAEFGSDAWNAKYMREDQAMQAKYLIGQWREIYEMSYGKGRVGNAIGGMVFQWSDGWWKFGQESRLDIHDTNASWPNAGYPDDYEQGENNMNEEWWGITAKGPPDYRGLYDIYPRAAYYALKDAWKLNPYAPTTDIAAIQAHFSQVNTMSSALQAQGTTANRSVSALEKARVSNVRIEFETYSTDGKAISTPDDSNPQLGLPSFLGFDHLESFYVDFEAKPSDAVTGRLSVNLLGNVPINPIDEIFYELAPRSEDIVLINGVPVEVRGVERVRVYQASVSWQDRWFNLEGFYRVGHTHWGYEGDFFGFYPDAYYGENLDIYNGQAPVGVEIAGKKLFDGFKLAFGPQLWWGANPAILVKYNKTFGPLEATGIFHEDVAEQSDVSSSIAVPLRKNRRAALNFKLSAFGVGIEAGAIWAGDPFVGEDFQVLEESGGQFHILRDFVKKKDTVGAKLKLTLEKGGFRWYGQGAYQGLVAMGGGNWALNYTNWRLKDSGWGNQMNLITGAAVNITPNIQFGPNFLWQQPLTGPIPGFLPPPARPRNIRQDPFAVRANRETFGAEFVIAYDPTPATWMWQWDNDVREDARLAASLSVMFKHHPTTMDAAIGILADGTPFAFPGATPPRDLWEANVRIVSRLSASSRLVAHAYAGRGEPNGDNNRLIERIGGDARLTVGQMSFFGMAKVDDWGPYDYHRDFNLTFPLQLTGDVAVNLGMARWFDDAQTKFGVRGTWRSLNRYSNRYCPVQVRDAAGNLVCDPEAEGFPDGQEWEIRTYLHFSL